ncbi:hypothetical protein UPYG_G00306360 [Umbra pygmaea]|uniref:Uncharacterized protein n=1 Tax=Umbra pygmaea TaxID=75934 RepID=A0ABD0WLH4_UMBPY
MLERAGETAGNLGYGLNVVGPLEAQAKGETFLFYNVCRVSFGESVAVSAHLLVKLHAGPPPGDISIQYPLYLCLRRMATKPPVPGLAQGDIISSYQRCAFSCVHLAGSPYEAPLRGLWSNQGFGGARFSSWCSDDHTYVMTTMDMKSQGL